MKNPDIKIKKTEILSDNWATLSKITLDYTKEDGSVEEQKREVYERGNGAAILLFNKKKKTVVLIKQFRLPTYLNQNKTGFLIEACAGVLEEEHPEETIIRETEEETGYQIHEVKKVFKSYMSPGSVTEIIHFFVAEYDSDMKKSKGGGLASEHENIEVLEMPFETAYDMIATGEIVDAKTIMLLQYAKINQLLS
ncbi:GDP-mannose pyrophosphatase NudK [Flavobacterium sp.]|uniref:GDP-mannose pyrophosphatase NudK n=1 Tax=Flavobacterium sp. TaxID=239 RepID=UPI00262EF602|nr:GDP-mannose pyrophosphatase NudK [Flavobacterium sp.]MDD3004630.1 GDP-mannose pyrophosphatase NudK [Flavobacterium sp.]